MKRPHASQQTIAVNLCRFRESDRWVITTGVSPLRKVIRAELSGKFLSCRLMDYLLSNGDESSLRVRLFRKLEGLNHRFMPDGVYSNHGGGDVSAETMELLFPGFYNAHKNPEK